MSSKMNALKTPWPWVGLGIVALLFAAVATPNLLRSRIASDESSRIARHRSQLDALRPTALQSGGNNIVGPSSGTQDRKLVRISALELLVSVPDNSANEIIQLAETVREQQA
jgi:hypothetical protein